MRQGWGPPPRRRPPWWPEGEEWPPARRWGRRRPFFLWRFGCLFVLLLAVMVAIVSTVGWLIASLLRLLNDPFADGMLAMVSGAGPFGFILLFVALMAVVVVLFRGARGLGRMTRPMDELIEAAGRIESGDYSARVTEYGPRELRSVARAFNAMSTRLKASDERRRSFLADVTHELRTPLSVIRGQAEALADGLYVADAEHVAPILDATQILEALVEDLRTLALTEAGSLVLNREPVDPATLVDDTIASFEPQAEAAGISLTADVDEGVGMVDVDVQRMRRVIGNVVSNALRHTHPGGSVQVGVGSEPDRVVITVTDTGEGIAPELLPRVFERFVRGPGSTGSGLGLAIVHDIVTAHGGDVEIKSEVGKGTTLRLSLPIAPFGTRAVA